MSCVKSGFTGPERLLLEKALTKAEAKDRKRGREGRTTCNKKAKMENEGGFNAHVQNVPRVGKIVEPRRRSLA